MGDVSPPRKIGIKKREDFSSLSFFWREQWTHQRNSQNKLCSVSLICQIIQRTYTCGKQNTVFKLYDEGGEEEEVDEKEKQDEKYVIPQEEITNMCSSRKTP